MFKERFKQLRETKGLTQSQLATELEIGRASISNYELGTRTPDIDILVRIATYFGVSTDYLTGMSSFKTIDENTKFKKNSNLFDEILIDLNEVNKKDTFNFIKKLLSCINNNYLYDPKLYMDFFTANEYLIELFELMHKFIDSQEETSLSKYTLNKKITTLPYPESKDINELLTDINERLDMTYFYSRMLALKKACPELYNNIYNSTSE